MFRPSRFILQPPILNLIKLLYCQVLLFHVVATQWSDRPKAISHMSLHDKAVGRYENPGGGHDIKSKFYKKRGATFFYDVTHKLGPLDFTQYRSKSSGF